MSWSVSGIGSREEVLAVVDAELHTSYKCLEPEQTLREAALVLVKTIVLNNADRKIQFSANGSAYTVDGQQKQQSINISVSPVY